jgi:hypothetical protein
MNSSSRQALEAAAKHKPGLILTCSSVSFQELVDLELHPALRELHRVVMEKRVCIVLKEDTGLQRSRGFVLLQDCLRLDMLQVSSCKEPLSQVRRESTFTTWKGVRQLQSTSIR